MKILNVSNTINSVTGGGEAERTYQMSKYLNLSGVDCRILTIDNGLSEGRKSFLGMGRVIALPCLFRRFNVPKFKLSEINAIVSDVDIVHLMGHWTILNALVYLAIRKQNKAYVICPAGSLPIFGRSKLFKWIYNIVIGKKIVRNASLCIAVTEDEKKSFVLYGVREEKIQVIPNGISPADYIDKDSHEFRLKFGLNDNPFILFVGRLNLIKGPDLLLKAFCNIRNRFPDVHLVFAGPDSGMLSELKQIVVKEKIENRVHFLGYLGGHDKSCAYHAARILAIPSRKEAMSIVVLEAGICGTPALITDQCGFDEIADEGAGWVVQPAINDLAVGLIQIFSDPKKVESAARKIKEYVFNKFTWDAIVQSYVSLYTDIKSKN